MTEIGSLVKGVRDPLGLQAEVTFGATSPAVTIDQRLYRIFREVGVELLGEDKIIELQSPSMGSEDFGRYLQHVPGLLFRVGMGPGSAHLHQSDFDFNDEALETAMLMLLGLTIRICREGMPE